MNPFADRTSFRHLAEVVFGLSLAASGTIPPPGVVEAVLAGGDLLSRLSERRRTQAEAALRRATTAMEEEWEAWGRRSSRADAGARESAKAAFEEVAPSIRLTPADVAGRNLDPEAIAQAVLAKAAAAKPGLYGDTNPRNADHHLARQFLLRLTERAYAALIAEPGYMEQIAPALWRELLERVGAVQDDMAAVRREQVRQAERSEEMHAEVMAALARKGTLEQAKSTGVDEAVVIKIARAYEPTTEDDVDAALRQIEAAVAEAIALRRRLGAVSNHGEFADLVLNRMRELAARGDFGEAAEEATSAWAAEEQAEEEEHRARAARRIRLADEAIATDRLRNDPESAATWAERRVMAEAPPDRFAGLRTEQETWYERGLERGLTFDLAVSIELARALTGIASTPDEHGLAFTDMGTALGTSGQRRADLNLLSESVDAFRASLKFHTMIDFPERWATAQNNLGNMFRAMGQLLFDDEGVANFYDALNCYEAALWVWSRAEHPEKWAKAQNNLGVVLGILGKQTSGREGEAFTARAITAFEAALEVRTRTSHPIDWATTQGNLGNALSTQGNRSPDAGGLVLLGRAVAALEAALEVQTEAERPWRWAGHQMNLGLVLANQGRRTPGERGVALLARAVSCHEAALKVFTREEHPTYWANSIRNLASTYEAMGDHANCADPGAALRKAADRLAELPAALRDVAAP